MLTCFTNEMRKKNGNREWKKKKRGEWKGRKTKVIIETLRAGR
jgi:hypothetical protein